MKDFIKMTLATLAGLLVFGIVAMFLMFAVIGAIAASGDSQPVMPREGILTIDMSTMVLAEQTKEQSLQGNEEYASGLQECNKQKHKGEEKEGGAEESHRDVPLIDQSLNGIFRYLFYLLLRLFRCLFLIFGRCDLLGPRLCIFISHMSSYVIKNRMNVKIAAPQM